MPTVLVSVSEVATLHDNFEIVDTDVPETYASYDLNEWDEYALEAAVQLAEEHNDLEVVTVTIGPERAEETIRTALAKGADRAIRIWDDALADLHIASVGTKAAILAAVVEEEDPAFVLAGVQTGDIAFAATGVTLASLLDWEWSTVVTDLEIDLATSQAQVHRELEGGIDELVAVELPAVLTIQTGLNEPRYASLRGIRQAQQKELTVTSLDELGLTPSVASSEFDIVSMNEPKAESNVTIFEGDPDETAGELATVLAEKGVEEA